MYKISQTLPKLQVKKHSHGTTFTIVEDFIDGLGLSDAERDFYRKMKALIRMCGGVCDWAERRILAHLDLGESTYSRRRRRLEAVGLLVVERRRRWGCRHNETNLIRMGGFKNEPQKSPEVLKTTTPAPVARCSVKSDRQRLHELRREKDAADSRWMRAKYEAEGWRRRALARVKSTFQATLGMKFQPAPKSDEDDPTILELRRKHGAVTISLGA